MGQRDVGLYDSGCRIRYTSPHHQIFSAHRIELFKLPNHALLLPVDGRSRTNLDPKSKEKSAVEQVELSAVGVAAEDCIDHGGQALTQPFDGIGTREDASDLNSHKIWLESRASQFFLDTKKICAIVCGIFLDGNLPRSTLCFKLLAPRG